jgi:hypothetical protein
LHPPTNDHTHNQLIYIIICFGPVIAINTKVSSNAEQSKAARLLIFGEQLPWPIRHQYNGISPGPSAAGARRKRLKRYCRNKFHHDFKADSQEQLKLKGEND